MHGYVQSRAHQAYANNAVNTKSQGQLIVMLYDGAINFIETAEAAVADRQIEKAHTHIIKAQKIVNELLATLNMDAGETATQLAVLYQYMSEQLVKANMKKDIALLGEVRDMLIELRGTWKEIL